MNLPNIAMAQLLTTHIFETMKNQLYQDPRSWVVNMDTQLLTAVWGQK